MKAILSLISLILILSHQAAGDVVHGRLYLDTAAARSDDVTVAAGEFVELTAFGGDSANLFVEYLDKGTPIYMGEVKSSTKTMPGAIAGPCKVYLTRQSLTEAPSFVSYRLTKPDAAMFTNVLTLPVITDGNWEVVLETSSNLRDWSPAAPGSYPGLGELQFFRVHARKLVE